MADGIPASASASGGGYQAVKGGDVIDYEKGPSGHGRLHAASKWGMGAGLLLVGGSMAAGSYAAEQHYGNNTDPDDPGVPPSNLPVKVVVAIASGVGFFAGAVVFGISYITYRCTKSAGGEEEFPLVPNRNDGPATNPSNPTEGANGTSSPNPEGMPQNPGDNPEKPQNE